MQPLAITVTGGRTLLLVLFPVHPALSVQIRPQAPLYVGFHLLQVLLLVLLLVRFINQLVVPSTQPLVRLLLIRQP